MTPTRPSAVQSPAAGAPPAPFPALPGAAGDDTPFARLLSAQGTEAEAEAASRDVAPARAEDDDDDELAPPADPAIVGWIFSVAMPPGLPHGEAAASAAPADDAALEGATSAPAADDRPVRGARAMRGAMAGDPRAQALAGERRGAALQGERDVEPASDARQAPGFESALTRAAARVESARPAEGAATPLAAIAPHAETAAPASVEVATPVHAPEFPEALAVQVSVLARDGVHEAELHLNPADMGPISVHIALDGTQAQVDFGAASSATRQILEAGLPQLAAALRDAGLTLAGGGVSQHARGQSQQPDERGGREARGSGRIERGSDATGAAARRTSVRVPQGNVDLYA